MKKELRCNSCKEDVSSNKGSTTFKCPNCSKQTIIRCSRCRKTGVKYKCPGCGFSGPN
ncbi:MAG: zinc finger domain-containing protein [Candidatus Nanoarchaeia archaeon]|nr:zinc finger domain-containing protein [Candidatus Nanoarchaeia archaeon]